MNRRSIISISLLCVVLSLLIGANLFAAGQKQRPPAGVLCQNPTQQDLDCTAALMVGKGGFYIPTVEEGCDLNSPQGCKYPAKITGIESVPNPDKPGSFLPLRDADGHILVSIQVGRPGVKGGSFDKDRVPFTTDCLGCFRVTQSGDTVGF
jgi:hypothetical protein